MIYSKAVFDRFAGLRMIGNLYDAKDALKLVVQGAELTSSEKSAIRGMLEMLQLAIAFCEGRNEVSADQIDGGSAFGLFASTENASTLEQLRKALVVWKTKLEATLEGEKADIELLLEWLTRCIRVMQTTAIEESIGFTQSGWRL